MCGDHPGRINTATHNISLSSPEARPIPSVPYRANLNAPVAKKQNIDKLLVMKVVEPTQTEWSFSIVLVPDKDETLRFFVDCRKLNAATTRDSYPLPRMDKRIDYLEDAKIFSTLDTNSGY